MGRRQAQKASSPVGTSAPNPLDILSSVASLYADELKPVSRILRKRLLERTGAETVCIEQLRVSCESCALLNVELCGISDWAALLLGREPTFVNISSPQDLYPAALWHALADYWNGPGKGMCLPGGRYAFGQALQRVRLTCLEGRSFGQVCHIVQLALSQKKLLGYRDGCIGPYTRSELVCKEHCVLRRQPCMGASKMASPAQLPVASWEEARACLQEMLRRAGGKVALANVKRMFHSQFSLELSETAFGHSRVSDLLRDPRLQDVCKLELQSNGYMVVQVAPSTNIESTLTHGVVPSLSAKVVAEPLSPKIVAEGPRRVRSEHCLGTSLSAEDVEILADDKPVLLVPARTPEKADSFADPCNGPMWSLSSTLMDEERGARMEPHHVGPLLPRHADATAASVSDDASKWALSDAVDPVRFLWNKAWADWSEYSWGDQLMCSGEVDVAQTIRLSDGPGPFAISQKLGKSDGESDVLQEHEVNVKNDRDSLYALFLAQMQNQDTTEMSQVDTNTDGDTGLTLAIYRFLTSLTSSSEQPLPPVNQPTIPRPPGLEMEDSQELTNETTAEAPEDLVTPEEANDSVDATLVEKDTKDLGTTELTYELSAMNSSGAILDAFSNLFGRQTTPPPE